MPSHLTPPPPPVADPSPVSDAMAVFELDPMLWLPWGHQVINGGNARLSRSFYTPANDPPWMHQAYCIAVIESAPPLFHEDHWRNRVRDLITGPLNCHVVDFWPTVFGIGLFQLGSPNLRDALVQHGPFHLEHNLFVQFIRPDEAQESSSGL
jgi:hypothetical protein